VARDAVEERAERAARREAHVLDRLVAQELQHHELVVGTRAMRARARARALELGVGHHLEHEPDLGRRARGISSPVSR
jgi:hypothetical protein